MITIQVHIKESGKNITVGVEESMSIMVFMQQLRNKELIDVFKPYYLKTKAGTIYPPSTLFRNISEKEFVLVQDIPPQPPSFYQLGIFVLDGSASMVFGKTKANEQPSIAVDGAMKKVIEFFKKSSKHECFSFAAVAFGDNAKTILSPQTVSSIDETRSFVATEVFNNGEGSKTTNISAGLALASELAKDFFQNKKGNLIHRVVVILLTDGMCHHEKQTRETAALLKGIGSLEICSCHLETDVLEPGAETLLKEISNQYETVYSESTIRNFFINSTSRVNRPG